MPNEDEVEKRAAEIRAAEAAEEAEEVARENDLDTERTRLARAFVGGLRERTRGPVQCRKSEENSFAVLVQFQHLSGNIIDTCDVLEFGVDRIDGDVGTRSFLYYVEPCFGAAATSEQKLSNSSEQAALDAAIEVTLETMARVVAVGGKIGTEQEFADAKHREDVEKEKRIRAARRERSHNQRLGCYVALGVVFGICVLLGAIDNVFR